jgi:uncharacterized protein YbjT (DUF2867 family)
MTRALVLGATGFIGGHIALAALREGWQVRGLRRSVGSTGHVGAAPIQWFSGDLDRPDSLAAAFQGAEIVFRRRVLLRPAAESSIRWHPASAAPDLRLPAAGCD